MADQDAVACAMEFVGPYETWLIFFQILFYFFVF